MPRILNVAEKNDAAKSLAEIMSGGRFRRQEGFSKYNKIYEFECNILNQQSSMKMTSVSGHLLNYAFKSMYKNWRSCNPVVLFDADVVKVCPDNFKDIKRTLEREARQSDILIIWTDGDREGENIGYEIIDTCKAVKRSLKVYRARFSEITPQSIARTCQNLSEPDYLVSAAVDVRQQLDLRIGAAFTRFQTLRLRQVFPEILDGQLISFGSCQFPTLGFVVERYKQVEAFQPEAFYKIRVMHQRGDDTVEFNWRRHRLFDRLACQVILEVCIESPLAKVVDVRSRDKSKWRPQPMDTVELEKLSSRKLKISAKETMKIAEKLYTKGFISYPRTETNIFPKELDLYPLVQEQTQDRQWGGFAAELLQRGITPRRGKNTDNAHPPIHPTKYTGTLQGNDQRIYELICRHFLACCSQDAQGKETTVEIEIAQESFSAQGLMIIARNYLDVYPYDKWSSKVIPVYNIGDTFQPTVLEINDGETCPPPLLTEADLITLMDKHGIGTDATHAEHIETIKSRMYVGARPDGKLVPGELGMGLVEGYDNMGYELSKPDLRAELEADLKRICKGEKDADVVLREQVEKYKQVFIEAASKAVKLDEALGHYFQQAPQTFTDQGPDIQPEALLPVRKCPQCGEHMIIKTRKDGGYMLSCTGYPDCKAVVFLPASVLSVELQDEDCTRCRPDPVKLIKFEFRRGSVPPSMSMEYVSCLGGCDQDLVEALNLNMSYIKQAFIPTGVATVARLPARGGTTTTRLPVRGAATGRRGRGSNNNNSTFGNDSGISSWSSNNSGQRSISSFSGFASAVPASFSSSSSFSSRQPLVPIPSQNEESGGNQVVCNCGNNAIILTVRKAGPNTGREFYKCQSGTCDFFLWAETNGQPSTSAGSSSHLSTQSFDSGFGNSFNSSSFNQTHGNENSSMNVWGEVVCRCNTTAITRTVQKEGANQGRQFYTCSKPRDSQCGFFQWTDESTNSGSRGGSYHRGAATRGRGRGSNRGGRSSSSGYGSSSSGDDSRKRRKATCSMCGVEGHTKRSCTSKQ
ncbi:DNA topoisomerase 3-alpha-like [Anneissia japonica]|uniref:DNA topoisomerase 3-alpha-like n=1 Tax=Anneissia japonica TaxID=1529436 RepID=UPI0014256F24|nr:DNA topoisomerase 3-alpha-like [Anneissia japonica]